ncbi:MAG: hypothetical protein IJS01_12265 [Lentisphaeria bacterium]|nr:hypothetical protein [Lentisphaeria bacterium]
MKKVFPLLLMLCFASAEVFSEVTLDRVFSSCMVLQQQKPVVFFGTASPGEDVTVEFAEKKITAKAGNDGVWRTVFPAMPADLTARTVTVSGGGKKIVLKDVLVGEVWFCSGQSNMALFIGRKYVRGRSVFNCEEEVKNADHPCLRYAYQRYAASGKACPARYMWSSRWLVCKPDRAFFFSAAAYFFGRELQRELKIPVGLIVAAAGASRIQAWIPDDCLDGLGPESKALRKFKAAGAEIPEATPPQKLPPGSLFNGMAAAWTKLPVRGVVWYQGESNHGEKRYGALLERLITSWRGKWNDPEMPFLLVQLAGFDRAHAADWDKLDPNTDNGWALIREFQRSMLKLPHVGLATAVDIGECDNIHPGNKLDVGLRLALEAKRMVYGRKIVSRGPLFKAVSPEGNRIRVSFDNAEGLRTADGKSPRAFAVAGADGRFFRADAVIDGDTVVLSAPQVASPLRVRYAYAGFRGDLNLRNAAGLPAYPFDSAFGGVR